MRFFSADCTRFCCFLSYKFGRGVYLQGENIVIECICRQREKQELRFRNARFFHQKSVKNNTRCRKRKYSKVQYKKEYPKLMYSFFVTYQETASAPSISKFARSIGSTVEEIESFRIHSEFERAYRECNEIRRDYLIDSALCKRFDPSFVKFLISNDESDEEETGENQIEFTLKVLTDENEN